jgi:hypothetical protein
MRKSLLTMTPVHEWHCLKRKRQRDDIWLWYQIDLSLRPAFALLLGHYSQPTPAGHRGNDIRPQRDHCGIPQHQVRRHEPMHLFAGQVLKRPKRLELVTLAMSFRQDSSRYVCILKDLGAFYQ